MGGPLVVGARVAGKAFMKSPAGKRLKKKGIEAGKKLLDGVKQRRNPDKYKTGRVTDQFSTSNSTVRDRLTKEMKTFPSVMTTTEAAKAAAVSSTGAYLLGKKKK
jgi:hypothetical protein